MWIITLIFRWKFKHSEQRKKLLHRDWIFQSQFHVSKRLTCQVLTSLVCQSMAAANMKNENYEGHLMNEKYVELYSGYRFCTQHDSQAKVDGTYSYPSTGLAYWSQWSRLCWYCTNRLRKNSCSKYSLLDGLSACCQIEIKAT